MTQPGYVGAATAVQTVASTVSAVGLGEGRYGPLTCGAGVFANGFRAYPGSGNYIGSGQLLCADGNYPSQSGAGFLPPSDMTCPAGQVMVGFGGTSDGGASFGLPVLSSIGPRCQLPTGGAITQLGPLPGTGTAFTPIDCPAGQAVTGVVGGQGTATDAVALVCAAIPPPGPGSVFVPGTAGGTERALTWPGQTCAYCPVTGPGGTAPVNSGIVLGLGDTVTVTASGVVNYCGRGAELTPAELKSGDSRTSFPAKAGERPRLGLFARVGGGGWQFVGEGPTQIVAYQAGTLEFAVNDSWYDDNGGGWTVVVTRPALPSATVTPVGPFSAVYDGNPKSVAFTTTPGGLGLDVRYNGGGAPSAIGAHFVRASVTGGVFAGAATATFKIASTLAVGGAGGGPYERYCGSGVFANGFGVSPPNSSLWSAQLLCSDAAHPATFGNDDTEPFNTPSTLMACPAGEIMVGARAIHGDVVGFGTGDFMIAVAPRCQLPTGGAITEPFAPEPGTPSGASTTVVLDCPAGQGVTGVVGGAGSIVDSIALVCGPVAAITSVSPADQVAGFQMLTIYGTNLPATTMNDVLFNQGGPDVAAQIRVECRLDPCHRTPAIWGARKWSGDRSAEESGRHGHDQRVPDHDLEHAWNAGAHVVALVVRWRANLEPVNRRRLRDRGRGDRYHGHGIRLDVGPRGGNHAVGRDQHGWPDGAGVLLPPGRRARSVDAGHMAPADSHDTGGNPERAQQWHRGHRPVRGPTSAAVERRPPMRILSLLSHRDASPGVGRDPSRTRRVRPRLPSPRARARWETPPPTRYTCRR